MKGKRVILTGSQGFIGRRLLARLINEGATVIPCDLTNGIDVTNWLQVKTLPEAEVVYHLAASLCIPNSWIDPHKFYMVNVVGTLNMLEYCRLRQAKMIYASSYLYGDPQYLPVDESHPLDPCNPYAKSKRMAEELCRAYFQDAQVPCAVFRPFNVYGPGQGEDFLIPIILKQIKECQEIVLENPEPKRDLLYVDDMCEAYVKVGKYDGTSYEVFNIGFGRSYQVREIVEKIVRIYGSNVPIRFSGEKRPHEIMNTVADISKAKEKLGWEPEVDIDEGLKRVVDYYKET